jgi:xanthine dehydrogenase accessory factor
LPLRHDPRLHRDANGERASTAVATDAAYHAFVGSRRKMAALREKLIAEGIDAAAIDRIKAPAGLDLGAITPEEIAMSILAEITVERRRGPRGAGKSPV